MLGSEIIEKHVGTLDELKEDEMTVEDWKQELTERAEKKQASSKACWLT